MAKLNFPDPTLTQIYEEAGITWTWNPTLEVWSSEAGEIPGGGDVSVDVGDTRPSLPSQGDLWFCTAEREDGGGRLYVYFIDEDSGQWVDVSQPGGGGGDGGGFTEDDANALYLSKTTADVAQGAITFQGETTHEAGLLVNNGIINLNPNGNIYGSKLNAPYDCEFMKALDPTKPIFFQGTFVSQAGSGIGFKSVNSLTEADGLDSNCPRLVFNRCKNSSGLQINETNQVIRDNTQPCRDNSTLGEFNFATSQGLDDIYLCRFTAYKRAAGGELELSLHNSTTDSDHIYYFDPNGEFGYKEPGSGNTFTLNIRSDDTALTTTKDRFRFSSADHKYLFGSTFGADLSLHSNSTLNGLYSSQSSNPGVYGIHHSSNRTVSLKNSNGEIQLGTNGIPAFIKGADSLKISIGFTSTAPTLVAGSAPLYVRKAAIADSVTRISSETELELQGDDPTAYQTTYVLDDEGQQVEQQEYVGQTETLLEIIRDLRTRLAALEGA